MSFRKTSLWLIVLLAISLASISIAWPSQIWWTSLIAFLAFLGFSVVCTAPMLLRKMRASGDIVMDVLRGLSNALALLVVEIATCGVFGFVAGAIVCYLRFADSNIALLAGIVSGIIALFSWAISDELVPWWLKIEIQDFLADLPARMQSWHDFENSSTYE